ncbi:MAG TPA: sigma-70 family RNA polymerase sigma factor [Solirubrobacterales bacterium]|nr:sigma-70 family RNA polymerase sigma factor [Solirubrobacterales bacterium]
MPPPAEGFAARFVIGPALRTQPDRRLVTLVREGYENAFEEIVRRYGKPLTRYAAAIVGGRAEDVTQDAFSKALLALRRNGAEIELRPWLFRIIRNTALNDLRDSPPSAEALAEVIASGASPAEELERREELADLMRRLQSLPEAQRAAIVMRELEGLSHEEIASALGLSDGGARQAIYRARRSLRDCAGMLLPLPVLKALLAGAAGSPAVETAAGAAGVGGAAGAGVALKAAAAAVLVAGAVGAGVAIDHNRHQHHPASPQPVSGVVADDVVTAQQASTGEGSNPTDEHRSSRDFGKRGEAEPGGGHGEHGPRGNESGKLAEDHSGPGSGETDGGSRGSTSGENSSGHDGSGDGHGGGPGPSGLDGGDGDGHSGHGSGGSSGSGSSDSSGNSGPSDRGGPSGGGGGSGSSSGPGSGSSSDSSGSTSGSGSGSDSGSGPGDGSGSGSNSGSGSGAESGDGEPNFDDSGDSRGAGGFSVQMEPQTEEES